MVEIARSVVQRYLSTAEPMSYVPVSTTEFFSGPLTLQLK